MVYSCVYTHNRPHLPYSVYSITTDGGYHSLRLAHIKRPYVSILSHTRR